MAELAGYLDDQVVAEIRRELEIHLAECQTCRVLYDSSRKTLQIATDSRSFELPGRVSQQLVKKIMARVRAGEKRKRPKRS